MELTFKIVCATVQFYGVPIEKIQENDVYTKTAFAFTSTVKASKISQEYLVDSGYRMIV